MVESREALSLVENGMPFVIYSRARTSRWPCWSGPKARRAARTRVSRTTLLRRPVVVDPGRRVDLRDVTNPDAKAIEGHMAFYAGKVTVEQI